jgi:signal transduction histidine kinase/ActR/RegA family two-component response regulator
LLSGRRLARAIKAYRLSPTQGWSAPWRYASAPAATLLVSLAQLWVFPDPGIAPYVFMYLAPVLAAWLGGRLPGLLAVALSAAAGNFAFLGPRWTWATSGSALIATALFLVGASVVALLCASFRDAVIRAERTARELQQRYDEAQRARERLLESEARFRVLFESIDEGFCIIEVLFDDEDEPVDYRFLVTNPAFVTQTGLVGAEGKRMRELAPKHEEHWFETYGKIARTGEPARFQNRAEQLHRWYDVYAFRVGEPDDRHVAILFNDITRSKESEEALRDVNLQLAEAHRRKDEFLAVLSHELRNPLAPIKNSLFVLERAAPGGEQARRAHAVIERQVSHMTRLVADLLDVSRITSGKIRLQCEPIDLREVVSRTLEDHRSVFTARGIELHGEQPGRAVWVNGDATRLGQALGNLLHNSAKFTNEGGAVSVMLRQEGRRAVLRVRDTGVGIAPDTLGGIFRPFVQADRTLDRSTGGLGLGLALVKGVIELHGGEVSAHSEGVGRGAEFTLGLPSQPEPVRAAPPERERERVQRARRVLVIEDNEDAAESLKEALELDRHEVALAFDGPHGLEKARAFKPEVVLCDIGLPGMDGYEVARALRSDDALHDVALVALTGYALPEDLERAKDAGFDRHLAKPLELGALERMLAELPRNQRA